jgi:hypothetical protein
MQSRNRCGVKIKLSVRVRVRVFSECEQLCVSDKFNLLGDMINLTTIFPFFFNLRTKIKFKHGEYQENSIQL